MYGATLAGGAAYGVLAPVIPGFIGRSPRHIGTLAIGVKVPKPILVRLAKPRVGAG
jgi:hypothetical protein